MVPIRIDIEIVEGPIAGHHFEPELGRVVLGLRPGAHGLPLRGDPSVAPQHGEIREEGGQIVYIDRSAVGAAVDGLAVAPGDARPLKSGARLRIGVHVLEVTFETPGEASEERSRAPVWKRGYLASPWVRWGIGVYLAALCAVVLIIVTQVESTLVEEYLQVRSEYSGWAKARGISGGEIESRLALADELVAKIEVSKRQGHVEEARQLCSRLAALDRDPKSPIFLLAIRQQGVLSEQAR